jgi:hypothetical protein
MGVERPKLGKMIFLQTEQLYGFSLSKDSEHSGHLNEFLAESSFAAVRAISAVSSLFM